MEMQGERRVLGRFPGKRRQLHGWNRKRTRLGSPDAAIGVGQREDLFREDLTWPP